MPSAFTLANAALQELGNPRRFYRDVIAQFGIEPERKVARQFVAECTGLHRDLQNSPKFVWNDAFAALVAETAQQSPATFLKLWTTARTPYDDCWIEWNSQNHHEIIKVGAWIQRQEGVYTNGQGNEESATGYEIKLMASGNDSMVLLPVGLDIDLEMTFHEEADDGEADDVSYFWPEEYQQRWRGRMAMLDQLCGHISVVECVPPFHLIPSLERKLLAKSASVAASFMSELVCGLALMTTHLGGGAPIEHHAEQTKRQFYSGKFHPATEYQLVQLVRPMTARQLIHRALRNYHTERDLPLHPVIAAWHHRRETVDNCRVHPRACPLAEWSQLYDEEGEPLGSQLQECTICGRRRWHQKGHTRGNAAFGVIHKDYEIVTHRNRGRRKPMEA